MNNKLHIGVHFNAGLSCSKQINGIRKSCYYQMRDFAHIRHFLPKSVAITVANPLVSSCLDYCPAIHFSRDNMTMICVGYMVCKILSVT